MMSSKTWSQWLIQTMQAFTAALMGVSERRATDVVSALFLAEVGSSVYAASRMLGMSKEEALKEVERALCEIFNAALRLLEESARQGLLEENYARALRELGGERRGAEEGGG